MGVVLYIMLSGKVPFPGRTEPEIIHNVLKGVFHFNHPAFENVSEDCKDLIKCCLVKDTDSRYTANKALAHRWIITRADGGLSTGTIGDKQYDQVIDGLTEIEEQSKKVKNAALEYFSKKITPNNFGHL
mgnify:CR=1 FL=1